MKNLDLFAAAALQGLLANQFTVEPEDDVDKITELALDYGLKMSVKYYEVLEKLEGSDAK